MKYMTIIGQLPQKVKFKDICQPHIKAQVGFAMTLLQL